MYARTQTHTIHKHTYKIKTLKIAPKPLVLDEKKKKTSGSHKVLLKANKFIVLILSFIKNVTASFDNCTLQRKWLI